MNICIAGKNSIAVCGLNYALKNYSESHKVFALPNSNDNGFDTWQPSLIKFAKGKNVQIVKLEDLYEINDLVFISLEYDKIIDPGKFRTNQLFNIHFSLLPKYKGMYTSAHPILNCEEESGCTIHLIDKGIDTGDIIAQCSFKIHESDTAKDLYKSYLSYGSQLITSIMDQLVDCSYESKAQSQHNSTYYSRKSIDYSSVVINLNTTAFQIKQQLQAYTFRDYQLPEVAGSKVFGCVISDQRSTKKTGTIVAENEFSITVSTVDFDLVVHKDKFDALLQSILANDIKTAFNILQQNSTLAHESNERGWTPLIISAFNGLNASLEMLLHFGANPNATNSKGTTPLMYAKDYAEKTGDFFGLIKLLEYGANIRKKDIYGKSIIEYLSEESKFSSEILRLLKGK